VWELYHLDADPNELHDLAKQDPARLAQLQALFDDVAKRDHVYPLGPDFLKYKRDQVRKQLADRRGMFTYSGIVRGVSMDAAPPTQRLPFTLHATFDARDKDTRVLVAHGGAMGGFSLYLKDGLPVYCYNLFAGEVTYVRGAAPLAAGRHELALQFKPDSQGSATIVLWADGAEAAKGTIPKLTTFLYEASDGFSVGVDQGSSVSQETVDATGVPVTSLSFDFSQAAASR
jgi:arylsulfatase